MQKQTHLHTRKSHKNTKLETMKKKSLDKTHYDSKPLKNIIHFVLCWPPTGSHVTCP